MYSFRAGQGQFLWASWLCA